MLRCAEEDEGVDGVFCLGGLVEKDGGKYEQDLGIKM